MKIRSKVFLILLCFSLTISMAVGFGFFWDSYNRKFQEIRDNISSIVSAAAMLIDSEKHSEIAAGLNSESPEYQEISDKMREFKSKFPKIRNIYTMVKTKEKNIWSFVVDASEEVDENGNGVIDDNEKAAPPGEIYDVSEIPEMQKAFDVISVDEKIYIDKWGAWLSGYCPVFDMTGNAVAMIGVDVSADTISEERNRFIRRIAFISLSVAVLSAFLSVLLASSIVKPILKVEEAARQVSSGQYELNVHEERSDEIGELYDSITDMAANIKKRVEQLQALNQSSMKLALLINLEESLQHAVELVCSNLGASRAIVFLLNRSENIINLGISTGLDGLKVSEGKVFFKDETIDVNLDWNTLEFLESNPGIWNKDWVGNVPELKNIEKCMESTGINWFSPMITKQGLRGMIMMDHTSSDPEFTQTLIQEISLAIENARLYDEAIIDGLTRLYVHRFFDLNLKSEIKRAERFKLNFSLLMMDIDHFKTFNDEYGHQGGDVVLQGVSSLIKNSIRSVDIAARYGGEEISVILPETDIAGALNIAEKIRSGIEKSVFHHDGNDMKVTISIGASQWTPARPLTAEAMVKEADKALYRAKNNGRNRVESA